MPNYSHMNALQLKGQGGADSVGLLLGAGTAASPATSATAGDHFIEFRTQGTATSGISRLAYLRHYLAGAGLSGDALRAFMTIDDVAAATAHGAHISLSFDSTANTGRLTGLGVGMRATLHIPSDATWTSGTLAALQAEIYSDGADSDTDGLTEVSFIRVVNDGHADGIADVDDDAFLISIQGGTIDTGNLVQAETDETKFSHKIRCKVGSTTLYLMACAT